ncbi:MAG TPA: cytochrome c oxidase assembly protein [Actinomycetota bacterium]|nr:cytochrome c oxidase assembly protein [Actinomycetota bacterium]
MRRSGWLMLGVVATSAAVIGPLPALAERHFAAHMIQHLVLTLIAAPLFVLGAPVATLLHATSGAARRALGRFARSRAVAALTHPLTAWTFFGAVMWLTHFSPLYEAALDDVFVHVLEHWLFLLAGFLFWTPVIGSDPITSRMLPWPARLGYLVAALPVQSFLGLAIYSAERPLYDAYTDMDDQRAGALVMWLGGDLVFVVALALVVGAWMRADRRQTTQLSA